jgi:hypothetical protein
MNRRRVAARGRDARRWLRHAAGGAAAVVAVRGAPARGACYGGTPHNSVAVGAHLGIAFGGAGLPVKVNYGLTGRFGQDTAAFTRLEGFGFTSLQLTAGITQMLSDSVFAEGGGMAAVGSGLAGAGFHLALGPAGRGGGLLFGGSLPLVGDRPLWNLQISPFIYPSEICLPSGRALRTGEGVALPPVLAVDCARADDVLASAWLDDARAELASVPSFLRLADELNAVGAPAELRRAALAAADDERHHAAAAFAIASRWAKSPFAVAPLDAQPRFDRSSASALTQLAIEAWQDGCFGEGTAAACARRGLARVRDEQAAAVLARIAPDEERHADLSWRIVEWCWNAGGGAVRDAIAQVARTSAPAQTYPQEDADWLSWNGRLAAAERSSTRAQIEEQMKARLSRLLGSG